MRVPGAFVILCAMCFPSHVDAQSLARPVRDAIAVRGATTCLAIESLASQVATWLGRDDVDTRIVVEVDASDLPRPSAQFVLRRDGEVIAERGFSGRMRTCIEWRATLALAIALAIDATVLDSLGLNAERTAASSAPSPRPASLGPPWEAAVPTRGATVEPAPSRNRVRVEGAFAAGIAPVSTAMVALAFERRFGEVFEMAVGGLATVPVTIPVGTGSASVAILAARVDGCVGRDVSLLRLRACAGIAAGGALAQGHGFDSSREPFVPWAAGVARIEARLSVHRAVALHLFAEGLAPWLRPRLSVTDSNGLILAGSDFPLLGAAAGLGVTMLFP